MVRYKTEIKLNLFPPIHSARTQPIVGNATVDMLGKYFLPVSERLLEQAFTVQSMERRLGEPIFLQCIFLSELIGKVLEVSEG